MKRLIVPGFIVIFLIFLLSDCYYDSQEYLYPSLDRQCDTTNVTFNGSIKKILIENCLTCHSSSNAASQGGNIILEDSVVIANNDRLLGAVLHSSGFTAMPNNGGSLSTCNITKIKKWMASKAPKI